MFVRQLICSVLLMFISTLAFAQALLLDSPLPALSISDRGELFMENDDFGYRPWSTKQNPGKVHIVQYFGATKGDSELFKPFTDLLQHNLDLGKYHVTTIINLDAAMWGTSGFVISEIKSNKRKYPLATMVLDEEGSGLNTWQLGEQGAGLVILDQEGVVRYFTKKPMTDAEMSASLDLVKSKIDS
jgi:YtfJ family uncharacterized protein